MNRTSYQPALPRFRALYVPSRPCAKVIDLRRRWAPAGKRRATVSLPADTSSIEASVKITPKMVEAARRAEYDYYHRGRSTGGDRFIPTPDPVIRAMLQAALDTESPPDPAREAPIRQQPVIVTASKPRRR